MIERAHKEFEGILEQYLTAAEDLFGPYEWERFSSFSSSFIPHFTPSSFFLPSFPSFLPLLPSSSSCRVITFYSLILLPYPPSLSPPILFSSRYDILVMPPSFPYGGMENARLSFVTSCILAGDKSLCTTCAHEIAHRYENGKGGR